MTNRIPPNQHHLREWFDYDSATGIFTWRKNSYRNPHRVGRVAGWRRKTGYVILRVPGFGEWMAHRVAWTYVNGLTIGDAEIDHIDGDPSNNAISNLRLATRSQQNQNKRVRSNARSGLKGAFYHAPGKKNWRSAIKVDGRLIYLGLFLTPEEAHAAYRSAAEEHFGEFARVA